MESKLIKKGCFTMEDIIKFLKENREIKNSKELGMVLGKEFNPNKKPSTNTKKSWQKDLDCYCVWHKKGHKYIIDEVFDEPKERVKNRGYLKYDWLYEDDTYDGGGVYCLLDNDKNIYIGSTNNFKKRYCRHVGHINLCESANIVNKEHTYQVLYKTSVTDRELLQKLEQEWIDYFTANDEYNVVNKREAYRETASKWNKRGKPKKSKVLKRQNKHLTIHYTMYADVLSILQENGYTIENKRIVKKNK